MKRKYQSVPTISCTPIMKFTFNQKSVGVLLVFVITSMYIYIISVHRVKSYADMQSAFQVMREKNYDHRCKIFNDTHFNCLPNVFLIGASKCGTTSLMHYLSNHDNVHFVSRRIHNKDKHKEVHRFDRNTYGYALEFIDRLDEWASTPLVTSTKATVIHYTPHYLYAPTVPYSVKRFYPRSDTLKFIVMLRNPVDRALSSYWFQNSHLFHETGDQGSVEEFASLVAKEISDRAVYERCMNGAMETHIRHMTTVDHSNHSQSQERVSQRQPQIDLHHNHSYLNFLSSYRRTGTASLLYPALCKCFGRDLRSASLGGRHIDKGVYVDQVLRWLDNFSPSQFLFVSLQDMNRRPWETFQRILDFMQVIPTSGTVDASDINNYTNYMGNISTGSSTSELSQGRQYDASVSRIDFAQRRLERPNSKAADIPIALRHAIENFYAPYNEMLFNLLNKRDLY